MTETHMKSDYEKKKQSILQGGSEKYHQKNQEQGKLFVRDRLNLLFDDG